MQIFSLNFASIPFNSAVNFFKLLPKRHLAITALALGIFSSGVYYLYTRLKSQTMPISLLQRQDRIASKVNQLSPSSSHTTKVPNSQLIKLQAKVALIQAFYAYIQNTPMHFDLEEKKHILEEAKTTLAASLPQQERITTSLKQTNELIASTLKHFDSSFDYPILKVLNQINFEDFDPSLLNEVKETLKPYILQKIKYYELYLSLDGCWENPKFITKLIIECLKAIQAPKDQLDGTFNLHLSFTNAQQTGQFSFIREALGHFKILNSFHLDLSRGIEELSSLKINDFLEPLASLSSIGNIFIDLPSLIRAQHLDAIVSMIEKRKENAPYVNLSLTFKKLGKTLCEDFMNKLAAHAKSPINIVLRRWDRGQYLERETQNSVNEIIKTNEFVSVQYLAVI